MPESTDSQSLQDAFLLWNDTKRIMARSVGTDRLRAMMDVCEPTSLEGNLLTVQTRSSYAQSNLNASKAQILRALSEAAFDPAMDLTVVFDDPHWEESVPFPPIITSPWERTQAPTSGNSGNSGNAGNPGYPAADASNPSNPAKPANPIDPSAHADVIPFDGARTTLSEEEFRRQFASEALSGAGSGFGPGAGSGAAKAAKRKAKPRAALENSLGEGDSMFTFDTFVEGEENQFALMAAKQVANGGNTSQFNPLFIYGNSGLGKTHLLLSIKNYIAANDPTRLCVYKTAREFINDYTSAMAPDNDKSIRDNLVESYRSLDVLILDDIQHMIRAAGTIEFFFDTFNYLIAHSKQIVLAADVPPAELGMPERITSRMASGFPASIQLPTLELKRNLIRTFYRRDKAEGLEGTEGIIESDVLDAMAGFCGNNIRLIKSYVQQALFLASQIQAKNPDVRFTEEDAESLAKENGLLGRHNVNINEIQTMVEHEMGVSHAEIVSNKRNKEIAHARHVAIWLCRLLTDHTYKEIGESFGGRTHTTCLHSCEWVDGVMRQRTDRYLIDTITTLRRRLEAL